MQKKPAPETDAGKGVLTWRYAPMTKYAMRMPIEITIKFIHLAMVKK
jgi:hypothetical protein